MYGRTTSPLHAGLPTDRLVAEWWLQSPHVEETLQGKRLTPGSKTVCISIPSNIRQICTEDAPRAEAIQSEVREQFGQCIAAGRAAVGFEFTPDQGSYILEPYEDRID